jgi:Helix-turn-helix domain
MDEPVFTVKEIADFLRIEEEKVANPAWRRSVGLPAIRLGRELRFCESDLRKCLEGRREVMELR